jgi:hypothetical protein
MRVGNGRWGLLRWLAALAGAGCGGAHANPADGAAAGNGGSTGALTETFAVSDYFTPGLYTGDAQLAGNFSVAVNKGCKARPPGARGNCYVVTYYAPPNEPAPWAGIEWVFPANNSGDSMGRAVDTARFQQVRFFAAVEGPTPFATGGAEGVLTTFIGYVGNGSPNDDALGVSTIFPVGAPLDATLRPFHVPLTEFTRGYNCPPSGPECVDGAAARVIGAFGWSIAYPLDGDPTGKSPVKIYLDDVVWDTVPPPA